MSVPVNTDSTRGLLNSADNVDRNLREELELKISANIFFAIPLNTSYIPIAGACRLRVCTETDLF